MAITRIRATVIFSSVIVRHSTSRPDIVDDAVAESWELARAAIAGNSESARRYAELFLYLADPSFVRRAGPLAGDLITPTAFPPSASVGRSDAEDSHEKLKAESDDEPRFPGLYL